MILNFIELGSLLIRPLEVLSRIFVPLILKRATYTLRAGFRHVYMLWVASRKFAFVLAGAFLPMACLRPAFRRSSGLSSGP